MEGLDTEFKLSYLRNLSIQRYVHCPPKVELQPALFSSFVHNSSINELRIMKLSEHIYYESIN